MLCGGRRDGGYGGAVVAGSSCARLLRAMDPRELEELPLAAISPPGLHFHDPQLGPTLRVASTLAVSYTHLRAHEKGSKLVSRLLLEKKTRQSGP